MKCFLLISCVAALMVVPAAASAEVAKSPCVKAAEAELDSCNKTVPADLDPKDPGKPTDQEKKIMSEHARVAGECTEKYEKAAARCK